MKSGRRLTPIEFFLSLDLAAFPCAPSLRSLNPEFHLLTRIDPIVKLIDGHINKFTTSEELLRFGEGFAHAYPTNDLKEIKFRKTILEFDSRLSPEVR